MKLRKSKKSDIDKVYAMHRAVIGVNNCIWNDNYPALENVECDHETGSLYILENDGKEIIGSCALETENEFEDYNSWKINDDTCEEITRVVIAQEHQGHGYAKEMVRMMIEELAKNGCRSVHLFAVKTNPAATKTYKSLGFEIVGEYSAYGHDFYAEEYIIKED